VAVSQAPFEKIAAFRERMGWTFPWYSSFGSDFNYDFHATLDDRVALVLLHFRTEAELAEAGTPWTGGPWTEEELADYVADNKNQTDNLISRISSKPARWSREPQTGS
jgi:predicted dithiol-disulfide oxidoreductase (DUF899 family)